MIIWYSSITGGFYNSDLYEFQDGFIEISEELRTWLLNGQSNGQIIVMGEEGLPTLIDPPPPSGEVLLAQQSRKLQSAVQLASNQKNALTSRISVLQDAVDLEMATPEEIDELPLRQSQLLDWKRYAIFLGRVTSQSGWYETVAWPAEPIGGMDLSVSATSSRPASA